MVSLYTRLYVFLEVSLHYIKFKSFNLIFYEYGPVIMLMTQGLTLYFIAPLKYSVSH